MGDVVIFGFETVRGPVTSLTVNGMYVSATQLKVIRQQAGRRETVESPVSAHRNDSRRTAYQSCSICGSTRTRVDEDPWKVLYMNAGASPHEHHWEDGVHTGTAATDGQVVLVRRRQKPDDPAYTYGAFILDSERIEPQERTDYRWILRTDGGSVLDPAHPSVSQGSATNQNRVTFGPFTISWSGHEAGKGFLYYPRFAGSVRTSDDWELCLTQLSSFSNIDAADPQFVYKTSPVD
jgi:hypothetical protein